MAESRKNGRKRSGGSRRNRRTVIGLAAVFFCALLTVIVIQILLRDTISRYDPDVIISGVYVGETDVSGMTREQAKEAVEATLQLYGGEKITFQLENGNQAGAVLAELGISVKNLDEILQQAADYGKKGNPVDCYKILKAAETNDNQKIFPVEYQVTEEGARQTLEARLNSLLKAPVNARLTQSGEKTVVLEDTPGEKLDITATVANINQLIGGEWDKRGGAVQAETAVREADITVEQLSEITDVLGTFSTWYGDSSDGRKANVESGARHLDGMLVKPGEEVSVHDVTAPYTEENGYAMAPSYENGEVVDSMGGGICQVSTTLYNTLLLSEVEIVERYAHSREVSYVDPSMDAAIAGDIKDLKFRNNKETPIYIEAVLSDGNLRFNLYGKETRPAERTVEFESESLETIESDEKTYVATDDRIGKIYTKGSGRTGLTAQLWKIIYENGEEVSRETVNYSQYSASGETIAVGTASDNEEDTAKMREAVETQDEGRIKAAISEITRPENDAQTDAESEDQSNQ